MFSRWMDRNWWVVVLVAILLAYAIYHPLLRQVVVFILPLGRGIDDLIEWIALLIAGLVTLVRVFKKDIR